MVQGGGEEKRIENFTGGQGPTGGRIFSISGGFGSGIYGYFGNLGNLGYTRYWGIARYFRLPDIVDKSDNSQLFPRNWLCQLGMWLKEEVR